MAFAGTFDQDSTVHDVGRSLFFPAAATALAVFRKPLVEAGLTDSQFWRFRYTNKVAQRAARGVLAFAGVMIVFTLLGLFGVVRW